MILKIHNKHDISRLRTNLLITAVLSAIPSYYSNYYIYFTDLNVLPVETTKGFIIYTMFSPIFFIPTTFLALYLMPDLMIAYRRRHVPFDKIKEKVFCTVGIINTLSAIGTIYATFVC